MLARVKADPLHCVYVGAMYCTLLPMQTDTDCTDRECGMNYTVHGSPAQVNYLIDSLSLADNVLQTGYSMLYQV